VSDAEDSPFGLTLSKIDLGWLVFGPPHGCYGASFVAQACLLSLAPCRGDALTLQPDDLY